MAIEGIVSSPTLNRFLALLAEPLGRGRDLLLHLSGMRYIHSTGLGELVRIHDTLRSEKRTLLLASLDPDVLRLITMLGLSCVLHIYPTDLEALQALDQGLARPIPRSEEKKKEIKPIARGKGFLPIVAPPPPRLPEGRILLGIGGDRHFIDFLARSLCGDGERVERIRSREDVRAALARGPVDLAILESTFPEFHGICEEIKTAPQNGLVSILVIYPRGSSPSEPVRCQIVEDEFVTEPFEMREIVAVAESEYQRCREESLLFRRELHLAFPTSESAIEGAEKIIERLLRESGLPQDDVLMFFYAVREGVDNARRHGNRGDPQKRIDLLYVLDREKITITIEDEGKGFDFEDAIRKARAATPLEQARQRHLAGGFGGLGIGLMLRCCDKLEYASPGNLLKLTKYL